LNARKAPIISRAIAFFIDLLISAVFFPVFGLGLVYFLFKDSLKNGQSIGKGIMGIKVINYNTQNPASCSDSFGRNCGIVCAPSVFCSYNHRHLSDQIAGTIVIRDL
jgi:uncharacterized RDD family membrane protein YckC